MTARVFLDRSRKVPLEGRPLLVDWHVLLHVGMKAVERGTADTPWLSSIMWTGISPKGRFLRPLLFDFPMLRRWLEVEPVKATTYMRDGYGFLEAPRDVEEALAMLSTNDCYSTGLESHRLTQDQCVLSSAGGEWAVGTCRDCLRALLWYFPKDGDPREWPFYDQTVTAV